MKKIALIFGTRPEAIKMAPIYFELQRSSDLQPQVWLTAQHREMLDQVMDLFEIKAHVDLDLMQAGQTISEVTCRVITSLQEQFNEERPDLVVVQGDTSTTLAAALAAFYAKIPVAHIEAGLRTFDRYSPYPEEINRQLVTRLANFHFPATDGARQHLMKEGIQENETWVTGNTVIDALDIVLDKVRSSPPIFKDDFPMEIIRQSERTVLITGHRRENFGEGLVNICTALKTLSIEYPKTTFIYPVHLNPNVRKEVFNHLSELPNMLLIEPLAYKEFVWLMDQADLIITDSGGIQEEAPHLGKPILVTRNTTERPEGVAAGTARLVGTCTETIVKEAKELLDNSEAYSKMSKAHNPYGDGKASHRIVEVFHSILASQ